MKLQRRDTEYVILAGGLSLMSSRMHGSEEALATRGCHDARGREGACVLIGGLGMGYTLRATLDLLPADATVVVAELVPAVVEWNRGVLAPLANRPLDDARVQIEMGDVSGIVRAARARFDAVLLDVDNGPNAFTSPVNSRLYDDQGLAAMSRALKPGGVVAVWSAWESRRFEQRLKYAGFAVSVDRVRARLKQGGPKHVLFFGRKA
jgi:spermidine synthase